MVALYNYYRCESLNEYLGRLAHEIPTAVDHAITLTDDDRQAFSPMLAVYSARHEAQYSRLFRS